MVEDIVSLLKFYGVSEVDTNTITFLIDLEKKEILSITNLIEFPIELKVVVVKRVTAKYLKILFSTNKLKLENMEFGMAITSIKRGDVSTTFKSVTPEEKVTKFIEDLENFGTDLIYNFRRIKW